MSNFQEKYNNWQERMSKKTETEKHNYALTVAFIISAIVFFFIASNWYFQISGNSFDTSLFTDIEQVYTTQKTNFTHVGTEIGAQKNVFLQKISGGNTDGASSTTSRPTAN